jgi:hypothetical protein
VFWVPRYSEEGPVESDDVHNVTDLSVRLEPLAGD